MLLSILISLFFFAIVIVILVSAHELGHFLTAKWAGAYVERFSIGMGPVLFKKKYGETEYCLSAVPIGGYVKILGEDPEEADHEDPRNLQSKSTLMRLLVFASGSLNNIVLAIIAVAISFMIGIQVPEYLTQKPVIKWVAPDSTAHEAGLLPGDSVIKINNVNISTWQDFMENIGITPKGTIDLKIERNNVIMNIEAEPEQIREIGLGIIAVMHDIEPVVYEVLEGYPAYEAGIESGDRFVSIDEKRIDHWNDLSLYIRNNKDLEPMQIEILREGEYYNFELSPVLINGVPGLGIGRKPDNTIVQKYGPLASVKESISQCKDWIILTGRFLANLVSNRASVRSVGGPIMIADVSGAMGRAIFRDRFGSSQFLMFLGFISLQLGIINLMPLPVLDGGHILFLIFEKIFGREKIKKAKTFSQIIGIVLLLSLAVLVIINDILRIIT